MNVQILDKIRKVLAKSSNNPSKEEAETALLMAQKMMVENGITMQDLNTEKIAKEVIDIDITEKQKTPFWYKKLAKIIADNFKCYSYTQMKYQGSSIKFMGLKQDVETTKEIFYYAVKTITYNYKQYLKNIKNYEIMTNDNTHFTGIKNSYILGYLVGLDEKFKEQVNKNQWGLILIKDIDVQNAYKKMNLKTVHSSSHIRIDRNSEHKQNGYTQGKQFQMISGELKS